MAIRNIVRLPIAVARLGGALALALGGCATPAGPGGPQDKAASPIAPEIVVNVTSAEGGGYGFLFSGPYVDSLGNMDFSSGAARGRPVKIEFRIDPGSVAGLRFMRRGEDAMWIVEKVRAGPDGYPQGPYRGDQFTDFITDEGGLHVSVLDRNDDGKLYRYALRFELNGEYLVADPDIQNGGGR